MAVNADTPESANARFLSVFAKHESQISLHDKSDPDSKRNDHKHIAPLAELQRWTACLRNARNGFGPSADGFRDAQERNWAGIHLQLGGPGNDELFWRGTRKEKLTTKRGGRKEVLPPLKMFPREQWGARVLQAHITSNGCHRGRDQTYAWARDPERGLNPANAPVGNHYVKAPMKEVIMDWIRGCPHCGRAAKKAEKRARGRAATADASAASPFSAPATAPAWDSPAQPLEAFPAHTLEAFPAYTFEAFPAYTFEAFPEGYMPALAPVPTPAGTINPALLSSNPAAPGTSLEEEANYQVPSSHEDVDYNDVFRPGWQDAMTRELRDQGFDFDASPSYTPTNPGVPDYDFNMGNSNIFDTNNDGADAVAYYEEPPTEEELARQFQAENFPEFALSD